MWDHCDPIACEWITLDAILPYETLIQVETLSDSFAYAQYVVLGHLLQYALGLGSCLTQGELVSLA